MKLRTLAVLEGVVLGLAVAVRVAGLVAFEQTLYADHPMVDAYTYWDQATAMLAGKDPFAEGFYQPPGYPVFLWALARLTGGADLVVVRLAQAWMGVLTTGLLVLLGRRVGEPLGAPWMGAAAGLLFTLYPSTLLFEQDVLTPALTCLLSTAALSLLWDLRPADPATGAPAGPSPLRAGLAGLLQGLAVVVHPTYLLASLASGAWLLLQAWRAPDGAPLSRRAGPTLAFALALGLALTPTAGRNHLIHHQPALVSHNGGLNFYLGNNLGWRETMFLRPGLPFRRLVLEAEPDKRDVAQRNEWWWQRTREEIADHPVAWLSILGTKALWSVHDTEIPRNEDYRCRTDQGPLAWLGGLPVRYGLALPLALAGAVILARRGGGGPLLVGTWVALHLPLVIFLVADRYRLATWPVVCLAAAAGLHALLQAGLATRDGRRPARAWLLLLPVLPLPFLPIDARTSYDAAWCLHVDGNLALMAGDEDGAVALYQQAMALDPDDWGARDFLARTLAERGETTQAITLMEPLVAWFPDHYPSLYFLAGLYQRADRLDQAADTMGRAWRVPGDRTNTGVRYVKLLVQAGRRDEARQVVAATPALQGHPGLAGVLDR